MGVAKSNIMRITQDNESQPEHTIQTQANCNESNIFKVMENHKEDNDSLKELSNLSEIKSEIEDLVQNEIEIKQDDNSDKILGELINKINLLFEETKNLKSQLNQISLKLEFLEHKVNSPKNNVDRKVTDIEVHKADKAVNTITEDVTRSVEIENEKNKNSNVVEKQTDTKSMATEPVTEPATVTDEITATKGKVKYLGTMESIKTTVASIRNSIVVGKAVISADGFEFGELNGELYLKGVNPSASNVIIPCSVNGMPVVGILGGAFEFSIKESLMGIASKININVVYLPKSIKFIDTLAFSKLKAHQVIIPKSITKIEPLAFKDSKIDELLIACDKSLISKCVNDWGVKSVFIVKESNDDQSS